MGSVLAILGRLRGIIFAFFRGLKKMPPSVLPLSMKVYNTSESSGRKNKNAEDLGVWEVQKEEFLRHPSLRATPIRHQGNTKAKVPKSSKAHKHHRSSHLAHVTASVHDWLIPVSAPTAQPPPRPPRPYSSTVPSVIVTPCTPTTDGMLSIIQECIHTASHASPLELTIAAFRTAEDSHPNIQLERGNALPTRDNEPGSDPLVKVRDITDLKAVDAIDDQAVFSPAAESSPDKSFALTDSWNSIIFERMWNNSKVRSVVSGLLRNTPPWINSGSTSSLSPPASPPAVMYVTSTPIKAQANDLDDRSTTQRTVEIDTPTPYNVDTAHILRLPDGQIDLLPYPDVFDLDLYYGSTSDSSRDSTDTPSSIIHCSVDYNKNPFAPQDSSPGPYLTSPPYTGTSPSDPDNTPYRAPRRFGFIPETPDVSIDHDVKRYRDHYRHPAFSVSPQASSENTSADSVAYSTPTPNPRGPSIRLAPAGSRLRSAMPLPLRDLTNQASDLSPRAPPSSAARTPLTLPEVVRPLLVKAKGTPLPIVVVSHHRFGTSSPDSLGDTDDSKEALKASLQETCHIFSKSVSTDNSYSM